MKINKKSSNKSIIIRTLILLMNPMIASIALAWDDCPFGKINKM